MQYALKTQTWYNNMRDKWKNHYKNDTIYL